MTRNKRLIITIGLILSTMCLSLLDIITLREQVFVSVLALISHTIEY